jgi:hypothetical protein
VHQDTLAETRPPISSSNTFGTRVGDNMLLPVPLRDLAQTPEGSCADLFFEKSFQLGQPA